ncbi:hypothetical protein FA13DRAFT_382638 [Coprinellus micaceus]|uniref:Uncharacterized protein n=1 Tax=Coprinellus micaceus TaxID=71717 RepID=A0A4Y7SCU7_COPMI|nr:hypothetical protein FA13DRAFT_382638 [Coprinellus micaceus]
MKAPKRSSTESVHAHARVYQVIYGNDAPVTVVPERSTFNARRNNVHRVEAGKEVHLQALKLTIWVGLSRIL